MHRSWRSSLRSALLLAVLPATISFTCAWSRPALAAKPNRALLFDLGPLTKQQRLDDFEYLCNVIEEQYAPLQLKEKTWGFKWEDLKATYRERITRGTMSHGEFGTAMRSFVANLHDAHTGLIHYREAVMNGMSMRVSTLGFIAERRIVQGKSEYVVGRVFPNFFGGTALPVQPGDVIVAIDGRTPETIIREDLAPLSTTGREDSDATVLARDLGLRMSPLYAQRPTGRVKLSIKHNGLDQKITLAWVDASADELRRAMQRPGAQSDGAGTLPNPLQSYISGRDARGRYLVQTDREPSFLRVLQGEQGFSPAFRGQYAAQPRVTLAMAARFSDVEERRAPFNASPIEVEGLPFYIFQTEAGLAASYRVDDFMFSRVRCEESDPGAWFSICRPITGEDYAAAFATLALNFGVRDLILDLRDNGGGALAFSDELLRAFGPHGLEAMEATVRLNEMWLGTFSYLARDDYSPVAQRASFKHQERILRSDIDKGSRLSSPVYLMGTPTLAPNPVAVAAPRLHVLINETCASACDLFAAAVQDQKLGTILGRRSMGAGGNVVHGGKSPHEGFSITQTASLALRADGSYVENQGVTPDVVIDENEEQAVWKGVIDSVGNAAAALAQIDTASDAAASEATDASETSDTTDSNASATSAP